MLVVSSKATAAGQRPPADGQGRDSSGCNGSRDMLERGGHGKSLCGSAAMRWRSWLDPRRRGSRGGERRALSSLRKLGRGSRGESCRAAHAQHRRATALFGAAAEYWRDQVPLVLRWRTRERQPRHGVGKAALPWRSVEGGPVRVVARDGSRTWGRKGMLSPSGRGHGSSDVLRSVSAVEA